MGNTVLGVLLMLLSTSMVNVGAVLQKKAVDALPPFETVPLLDSVKAVLRAPIWLIGWAMASSAIVLNMVALGLADISVIQPLNGFGLVVLVLFSRAYLGERLDRLAVGGVALVIAGVAAVGLTLPESRVFSGMDEILGCYTQSGALLTVLAGLGGVVALVLVARKLSPVAGILFSLAAAGCSVLGLTFSKGFFGSLTLVGFGATLGRGAPWLLLGLLLAFSATALALQQLSFQKGRAVVVTPVFASASVVLPLFAGRFVFAEQLPLVALVGPALIVVGVVLIGMRGQQQGEPEPSGYHDNEALLAEVERLVARVPERARLGELGTTVQGRTIPVVHLARGEGERPSVLVLANEHGNEVIGSEVALDLLHRLTDPELGGAAAELLELADVVVVPALNLDGRAPCVEALAHGRWGRAQRANAKGVDLNRNFPWVEGSRDVWHPLAGSPRRWSPWYRGEEPLSEPESRALVALVERLRPAVSLNLHSVGRLVVYPWCCKAEAPADEPAFRAMGEAFVAAQPGRKYAVKQSNAWYAILGDLDDWMYDRFGTLAITVELSAFLDAFPEKPMALIRNSWWMNPVRPDPTVDNTAEPCLRALVEGLRWAASRSGR